jgi:hypothetical protein
MVPLVLVFSPVAVWALRLGGLRRLWSLSALALLVVLLLALVLSAVYSVPSRARTSRTSGSSSPRQQGDYSVAYSPECVEEEFCELCLYGVLRSSPAPGTEFLEHLGMFVASMGR